MVVLKTKKWYTGNICVKTVIYPYNPKYAAIVAQAAQISTIPLEIINRPNVG